MGPVDGVMFDVCLEWERLHPDDSLLRIPDDVIDLELVNAGNMIQALREEVSGPVNQMNLTGLLCSHTMDTHTVLDALSKYFHDT